MVGDAVYSTKSIPCDWAGAVMQKPLANAEKANDIPTDRQTDTRTDEVTITYIFTQMICVEQRTKQKQSM